MAPVQHPMSHLLFAALLLLCCLGRSFGEAAQLISESIPDLDISEPVKQRLLLSEADVIEDQDFPLAGAHPRHLLQTQVNPCFRGQTPCPSGIAECYFPYKACDGTNDCSDGSDEDPGFCSNFRCDAYYAKCPSGKCTLTVVNPPKGVSRQFVCDGISDCRDNSDEDPAFCASFDCAAAGSVTCPGPKKQCIPLRSNTLPFPYSSASGYPTPLCDGTRDCADGSDEDPTFCATYTCENNAFKCRTNQCVARYKVCDGNVDCPDGSDEDPGLCGPGYNCSLAGPDAFNPPVHCPSGVGCYPGNGANCDGNPECLDKSDENPTICDAGPCPNGLSRCPSGSGCFYLNRLCNGDFNCIDKSDERGDVCANFTCNSAQVKCPGQGGCLFEYRLCNGVTDCIDGSDEASSFCGTYNCGSGRTKCPSGVACVNTGSLCDGIPNGPPGCNDEDPAFCAGKPCPSGFRCRDNSCRQGNLCDGKTDCPDGSDEDPSYCQATQCPTYYSKCADNTHCFFTTSQCDGKFDCADKSDEDPIRCNAFECVGTGQIKCPGGTGQCFQSNTLCDGVKDCTDGSDEVPSYCASYQCGQGRFKCPGTNVCVTGQLCNGVRDCPDNSDESDAVCRPGATSSPTVTPASTTGAPSPTSTPPSDTPASTTGAPSPTTPPPSNTPASTTGAPAPTGTTPSSTPPATTEGPSPTTCDPNSATPNRCFNGPGNSSICCPGQCPEVPTDPPTCGPPGFSPTPPGGACDPTSSLPNKCSNADGSQSVCCPGDCPYAPGPTATCA